MDLMLTYLPTVQATNTKFLARRKIMTTRKVTPASSRPNSTNPVKGGFKFPILDKNGRMFNLMKS